MNDERREDRWIRKEEKIAKGKKTASPERNTRRRVRKSECHCRNLRTLTSSWLVPPSSWSQAPSQPPHPLPVRSLCPLVLTCAFLLAILYLLSRFLFPPLHLSALPLSRTHVSSLLRSFSLFRPFSL